MTTTYDFFGPFFQGTIITSRGQRVPLWMRQGNNDAQSAQALAERARTSGDSTATVAQSTVGAADRPYLQEVSVKLNLGGIPVITARLTPTYEQGIEYLNSTLSEWGDSQLEVVLGYSTGGSGGGAIIGPAYTGLLLKPDIQIGPEISITLNAQGVGSFNLHTTGSTETMQGTRETIVGRLLRGPDPSNPTRLRLDLSQVERASGGYNTWFEDQLSISLNGRTHWQWISNIVWEARCWLLVDGNTVRVLPRARAATEPPKYILSTFHFPGSIGSAAGVFPILTASSPTMGAYLPGVLRGMAVTGTDSRTRSATSTVLDDASQRTPRSGQGTSGGQTSPQAPGAGPSRQLPQGLEIRPQENAEDLSNRQIQQARAEYEGGQSSVGIRLEIETLGIPDIVPGDILAVRGLGIRVDGPNYVVMDATHVVSTSGFTTRLTLIANVASVLEAGPQALGPTNTQRTPEVQRSGLTGLNVQETFRMVNEADRRGGTTRSRNPLRVSTTAPPQPRTPPITSGPPSIDALLRDDLEGL